MSKPDSKLCDPGWYFHLTALHFFLHSLDASPDADASLFELELDLWRGLLDFRVCHSDVSRMVSILLPAILTLPELPSSDSGVDSSSWRSTSRAIELVSEDDDVSIDGPSPSVRVLFSVSLLAAPLALSTSLWNSSGDDSFNCNSAFSWSADGTFTVSLVPVPATIGGGPEKDRLMTSRASGLSTAIVYTKVNNGDNEEYVTAE